MKRYLIRRLIQSFFLLWLISALFFGFQRLTPGGPEAFIQDPRLRQADVQRLREQWGLNDPIPIQYVKWVSKLLQGDFGRSFQDSRPVMDKIVERLPATLELNVAALLLGLFGIPMGIVAAVRRGKLPDHAVRLYTVLFSAIPDWWFGLMLLIFLGGTLRLVPLGGLYTIGQDSVLDRLWHLALPAVIAAIGGWVGYSRIIRSEVLEVLNQDFVRTARAKGLSERTVLYVHALKNALIPIMTGVGPAIAALVGGSVIYERVFAWPGTGRLFYEAAIARDYPVVMASFFLGSVLIMLGYLVSDIATAWIDPRVRFE